MPVAASMAVAGYTTTIARPGILALATIGTHVSPRDDIPGGDRVSNRPLKNAARQVLGPWSLVAPETRDSLSQVLKFSKVKRSRARTFRSSNAKTLELLNV
jgi:hypothetical protein